MPKINQDRWLQSLLVLILVSVVSPVRVSQPVRAAAGEDFTYRLTQYTAGQRRLLSCGSPMRCL